MPTWSWLTGTGWGTCPFLFWETLCFVLKSLSPHDLAQQNSVTRRITQDAVCGTLDLCSHGSRGWFKDEYQLQTCVSSSARVLDSPAYHGVEDINTICIHLFAVHVFYTVIRWATRNKHTAAYAFLLLEFMNHLEPASRDPCEQMPWNASNFCTTDPAASRLVPARIPLHSDKSGSHLSACACEPTRQLVQANYFRG